ncbi:hypothetical protein CAEBREN_07088 [Caenorhabditis brenneri]|uniref:F-box domain-containing protein n=1 Tax=Caenorhabditis brenneri TaxID=135651 RepID=G0N2D3_CAEBE|nr:hypothetical protein CAEBREN_07088 [Caenorhabditis brenneri]
MGLCCCKLLKAIFDSSNPIYYPYTLTQFSSVSAKKIPLLRLPLLALLEVYKSLDPIELFILSQCSKKVANCVHIVGSEKWKLSVDAGKQRININDSYKINIIESYQKPTRRYDRNLKTFFFEYQKSKNSELEFRKVLSQIQFIFRCPVTSFEYTVWCISDQRWSSVLKCIVQNQVQPLESFVLTRTSKTKDLEWALQNVKVTRKIFIQTYTHVYSFPRLNLTMFKSCKYIELQLSWLKICALNGFIEEWIAGKFPNLQYMLVGSDDFKECWCNHMFKREEMKQLGVRRTIVIDEKRLVECTGGCDIQADNGTKATMQMDRVSRNTFELFVWND